MRAVLGAIVVILTNWVCSSSSIPPHIFKSKYSDFNRVNLDYFSLYSAKLEHWAQ